MAGLTVTPDQIAQARAAGYSDQDIVGHLSSQAPDQFGAALKAGYSPTEILQHLAPQPSGMATSFMEGSSEAAGGIGRTLNTYAKGAFGLGDKLVNAGDAMKPDNYTPAPLYDKAGFHASNIPAWLAKQAPAAAGVVLAAGLAPEEAAAAVPIGLGAGAGMLMSAGDAAKEAAVKRTGDPNAEPNTADKTRGALTSAATSTIGALPVTHFIPGAGVLAETGASGVANALKRLPAAAVDQSAASAASSAAGQVGQTVGTPGGVKVDPNQVIDAAAGGAMLGPAFAAKNAAREGLDAAKYSEIGNTPEMQTAATQFANRITQNADGSLQPGKFTSSKAQEVGEDAFKKSQAAVANELNDAVGDLRSRVTLPTDADNALKSAMGGRRPSDKDYATIQGALAGDPQADNVMNLLRQAHVADVVGGTGYHTAGKFAGGLGGSFNNILKGEHVAKSAMVGLGAAAFEEGAGHIIAYSPQVLGAAALGRLMASRLDHLTDAQTPAWRFVRNFGDEQTPVRLGVQQPQAPGTPPLATPWGPTPAPGPTGPRVGGGLPAEDPKAVLASQVKDATDQMAARRANAALAARTAPAPQEPVPTQSPMAGGPGSPPMLSPQIQAQMAARANLAKLTAAKAAAEPTPEAPVAQPAINPLALPTSITGPARAIMRGATLAQKQRDTVTGQDAANAEVNASPFIEQKLNGAALPTPAAAKAMKTAIGSASALAKLRSDPEAEVAEAEQAKSDAAAEKQKVKEATALAKVKPAPPPAEVPAKGPIDLPNNFAGGLNKGEQAPISLSALREAVQPKPEPIKVEKVNSTTKVNDEPFPPSSYAHLPAKEASQAVLKDALAGEKKVYHPEGYRSSTQARIEGERQAMARIGHEVPGLNIADLTARLEGTPDQGTARAFREHLKNVYPRGTASFDQHLSDEAIKRLWKMKGPK